MHFFDFDIVRQPAVPKLEPAEEKQNLLIIFRDGEGKLEFLKSILKAAGYQHPEKELYLLPFSESDASLDLAGLLRHLKVSRAMVFGLSPEPLGYHLRLAPYVPIEINQRWILLADDLADIFSEKEAGKPQKAGALWQAVKAQFLHPSKASH